MNLVSGQFRPSNVGLDQKFIHLSILDLCFKTHTIDDPAEYSTVILAALSIAVQAGEYACETATLARLTKMRVSSSQLLQE